MSDAPTTYSVPLSRATASRPSTLVLALLVLNLGASGFATFKLVTSTRTTAARAHVASPAITSAVVGR
jgi:hypothetical protein